MVLRKLGIIVRLLQPSHLRDWAVEANEIAWSLPLLVILMK